MKVPAERRDELREAIEAAGATAREARGTGEVWRYQLGDASVTLWRTGTVRVDGKDREALRDVVEQYAVAAPAEGDQRVPPPTGGQPWIGVDESGKGDYFGPLVSVAAYVDPRGAAILDELGVRDSKKLTDRRIHALAPQVREVVREASTIIAPPRYNELYDDFRRTGTKLNGMLAWAHARSVEELLAAALHPGHIVVDRFDAKLPVEARLRKRGIPVHEVPRAEADVAVAAASVLAREAFLSWLEGSSRRAGVRLPKGAGPAVIEAARGVYARGGEDALRHVAKVHFATTAQVVR